MGRTNKEIEMTKFFKWVPALIATSVLYGRSLGSSVHMCDSSFPC